MATTFSDAREIISQAITALEKAEDFATGQQQLVLLDILEILRKERMQIDVDHLAKSNENYRALTNDIRQAKGKLDALTDEIKALIRAAEQAAQVAGALAKLVQLAASIII
jgi:hypothetical protein